MRHRAIEGLIYLTPFLRKGALPLLFPAGGGDIGPDKSMARMTAPLFRCAILSVL
ncbi:hypothetical protein ACFLWY_05355 [Chloroflexota bacterium]